eukprot:11163357-Lingulodinium_polyedra.AAC.1
MHRRPPRAELSTPGSAAVFDVSSAAIGEGPGHPAGIFASAVDLVDTVYQFPTTPPRRGSGANGNC